MEIVTQFNYDAKSVLRSIAKNINNTGFNTIANYNYDEYGRLKNKMLAPNYTNSTGGNGLETLDYTYNINGLLKGINEDFATNNTTQLNQFDHYFGIHLGYENGNGLFADNQYNGNLTGVQWRTLDGNRVHKYNYKYDKANRFIEAEYTQKDNPTVANWTTNKLDFSVNGISYDDNSNLLSMQQFGVLPGVATPVVIDKLSYTYKTIGNGTWSNKLHSVTDAAMAPNTNGLLGDFKDETYGAQTQDYDYDANGNLITDNNKKINGISGIVYNYLDKPWVISITGKSKTTFTYSANGTKLSKRVENIQTGRTTTTWYIGAYVFTETSNVMKLHTIQHEEGRVRVYEQVNSIYTTISNNYNIVGNNMGVYEYFVKDHLQNNRIVLTEESHTEKHTCSMETNLAYYEERMFGTVMLDGNPATNNEVQKTRIAKPIAWSNNSTAQVSKLMPTSSTDNKGALGPNMFLKVMAGDYITKSAKYFYLPTNAAAGPSMLSLVTNSLVSLLNGNAQAGDVKSSAAALQNTLPTNADLNTILNNQNQPPASTPHAYLNVLFFDENFNLVNYNPVTGMGSNRKRVDVLNGTAGSIIQMPNIRVPNNGYVYVYLSNQSMMPVYFDDFKVEHNRGQLVEENHYYAYGLRIKGIGGKAFNKGQNPYGYQGTYSEEEEETSWNEFDLRMYNPQIGRWNGIDPMDEFANPYLGMGANPVNNTDPSGESISDIGAFALYHFLPGLVGAVVGAATTPAYGNQQQGALWGFMAGFAASYAATNIWSSIGVGIDVLSDLKNHKDVIGGTLTLPSNAYTLSGAYGRVTSIILNGSTYQADIKNGYFDGYKNIKGEKYIGELGSLSFNWYVNTYDENSTIVWPVAVGEVKEVTGEWQEDVAMTRLVKAATGLTLGYVLKGFGVKYVTEELTSLITTIVALGDFDNLSVQKRSRGSTVATRNWYGKTAFALFGDYENKAVSTGLSKKVSYIAVGEAYMDFQILYKGKVLGNLGSDLIITNPGVGKLIPPK